MDEVMKFLLKHENKTGAVGEFIRSCILVAERSEMMTRDELKDSAQLGYLLDCFHVMKGECDDDGQNAG